MSKSIPDWIKYWGDVSGRLNQFIFNHKIPEVSDYLHNSIAFFAHTTEDLEDKISKDKEAAQKLYSLIIEAQDLGRGIHGCYEVLTVAPCAILSRAAFELHCVLKYILTREDIKKSADLFFRFKSIELIRGHRNSSFLHKMTKEEEQKILDKNPEWRDNATNKIIDGAHWSGESKLSLETICHRLGWSAEYASLYRTTSKFMHGSPLLENVYKSSLGYGSMGKPSSSAQYAALGMNEVMELLFDYCKYFEIEFSEVDYRIIQLSFVAATKKFQQLEKKGI